MAVKEGYVEMLKTKGHLTYSGNGVCIGVLSVGRYDDKIDGELGSCDYTSTK